MRLFPGVPAWLVPLTFEQPLSPQDTICILLCIPCILGMSSGYYLHTYINFAYLEYPEDATLSCGNTCTYCTTCTCSGTCTYCTTCTCSATCTYCTTCTCSGTCTYCTTCTCSGTCTYCTTCTCSGTCTYCTTCTCSVMS